jgi:Na+/H+-dicarboxylate symporter
MILNAADLPTTYVGLIYAVDWFLDRFITASNVGGDALVVGIVNHFCGDVLPQTEVVDVDVDIDEDKDLSLKEL